MSILPHAPRRTIEANTRKIGVPRDGEANSREGRLWPSLLFAIKYGGGGSSHQSLPITSPPSGVQAAHHVSGLTEAATARTLFTREGRDRRHSPARP